MAEQEVLVFPRSVLSEDQYRAGFSTRTDILDIILESASFINRQRAETDPQFKQIIPYAIFRHGNTVFRYRRSRWGAERRLRGNYSVGVGGHIDRSDDLPLLRGLKTVVEWAREREVTEEFEVGSPFACEMVGVLNDDSNDVGRVHFGIVYEYRLAAPRIAPRERRVHLECRFVPVAQLARHTHQYESWSRILIEQYLPQLAESMNYSDAS